MKKLTEEQRRKKLSDAAKKGWETRKMNARSKSKAKPKPQPQPKPTPRPRGFNSLWLVVGMLLLVILVIFIRSCSTPAPVIIPPTGTPTAFQPVQDTPTPTPFIVEPTATEPIIVAVTEEAPVVAAPPTELFESPVEKTDTFNEESAWLIAEPGVICNPECPWTIMATKDTWYGNASEGGFLYISAGQIIINADGAVFNLPYQEGNNYLIIVRGRIDDGKIDTDRNLSVEMSDFIPGHAIFSTMPNGAYVSMDWFQDQLRSSMNVTDASSSKTNCGALGCSTTTILLFDTDSHFYQIFKVEKTDLYNWELLESGTK